MTIYKVGINPVNLFTRIVKEGKLKLGFARKIDV
jgi:hypothetical protein